MSFKIKDVCDINMESLSKKDDIKYINYLDTSNLTLGTIDEIQALIVGEDKIPSRAKRKVKIDDILISTVRPNQKHYGILKKVEDNMIASTGFAVLTPNKKIVDPSYLYNYLTQNEITEYLQGVAETSTTAYPSIKPSDIGDLEIELPPIEEQKSIAKILSDLDNKIEVNNKINQRLEDMAQSIFKHWFVDFEFPNEEGKPYKSSGGKMVESELGMIPKGWEVRTLDDIAVFKNGKAIKSELRDNNSPNLIYGANGAIGRTNKILEENNCIIIGRVGAYCGSIQLSLNPCWVTDNAIIGIVKKNEYLSYLHRILLNYPLRESAAGSAQPLINQSILKSIVIINPKLSLLNQYDKIFSKILIKIDKNNKENIKVGQLRDTLLPKLMSGEIRVPINK